MVPGARHLAATGHPDRLLVADDQGQVTLLSADNSENRPTVQYGSSVNRIVDLVGDPTSSVGGWLVSGDGAVRSFGGARTFAGGNLGEPVIAAAGTDTGQGLWLVSAAGRVMGLGDAEGSALASVPPDQQVVGLMGNQEGGVGAWVVTDQMVILGVLGAAVETDTVGCFTAPGGGLPARGAVRAPPGSSAQGGPALWVFTDYVVCGFRPGD